MKVIRKKKCKSSTCRLTKTMDHYNAESDICKECEEERKIRKEFLVSTKKAKQDGYLVKYKG